MHRRFMKSYKRLKVLPPYHTRGSNKLIAVECVVWKNKVRVQRAESGKIKIVLRCVFWQVWRISDNKIFVVLFQNSEDFPKEHDIAVENEAALKRYIDDHHAMPLCTAMFGAAHLKHYGIISRDLLFTGIPEGIENLSCVVAVSMNSLYGLYSLPNGSPSLFAPLRQREPTARIGYSIYVFDLRH
jgi:hypothetical protein